VAWSVDDAAGAAVSAVIADPDTTGSQGTASSAAVAVAPTPGTPPTSSAPAATLGATTVPGVVPEQVAAQLSAHLRHVRRTTDGRHEATLVLDPEHLGPVRVRLTLDDGALHVQLAGLHPAAGDALRDALPDLRRQLADAGLALASADVADQGAWDAPDRRPATSERRGSDGRPSPVPRSEPEPSAWLRPRRTGGLDLVV
jgi:flagellar hook-length control protein FliK